MLFFRKIYSFLVAFTLGLISYPNFANSSIPLSYLANYVKHNSLVIDAKDSFKLPRHFRTSEMPVPGKKQAEYLKSHGKLPSFHGYHGLKVSASAQFSKRNILAALSQMDGKIYIIDLRKESHGFLNGNAISWSGKRNWANEGKTDDFVNTLELSLFQHLNTLKQISICYFPKVQRTRACKEPDSFNIDTTETEEQLIKQLGLEYRRFPVLDKWRPDDQVIDQFLQFIRSLPKNAWLHFHCRGGSGRTTTFLVMYDIIKNGKNVKLEDIIARHALAGVRDLQRIPHVKYQEWVTIGALKRLDVIEKFYKYVCDPEGYSSRSWTEWLNLQKEEFTS
ncbi:MAG: hypothetical protein BGO77_03645 [Caedibacter sp. 37-49]|nr:MAG: hypothetical protein BGO77_03645 [Caedibacter sp. 37-49]